MSRGGPFDTLKLKRFELADVLSSAFDSRILHQREEECSNSYMLSSVTRPCMLYILAQLLSDRHCTMYIRTQFLSVYSLDQV